MRRKEKKRWSVLDVTPLVDLIFLLIIFFLLSTTFRVMPGIKIDLPEASSQKIVNQPKEIILSVDQGGAYYLDKSLVEPSALPARLAATAREDGDTMVIIKGDRAVGFGRVVDLLGAVKQAGLHRIAIMTQPKKGPPAPW